MQDSTQAGAARQMTPPPREEACAANRSMNFNPDRLATASTSVLFPGK